MIRIRRSLGLVVVIQVVDHLPDEVDPEAPRTPLLDPGIYRRNFGGLGVEGLDIDVDQLEVDAVVSALDTEGDAIAAALIVADHVGEELLDHEVDAECGFLVDLLAVHECLQKREDLADGLDLTPKLRADRRHSSIPPVDATRPLRPRRSTGTICCVVADRHSTTESSNVQTFRTA